MPPPLACRSHPGVRRARRLGQRVHVLRTLAHLALGLGRRAAREKVRVARALGTLPCIRAALAHGEISYSKVRELTRVATSETEERLLKVARAGTAVHVERIVRAWRRVDRQAEEQESARWRKHRGVRVYHDDDGMVVISGRLEPEAGALLMRALDAARETLYQRSRAEVRAEDPAQEPPDFEQQSADALVLVAETALHHELDPARRGSVTRWSCTSMPRSWRTWLSGASRFSMTECTFPRRRPSAWRATRAGW